MSMKNSTKRTNNYRRQRGQTRKSNEDRTTANKNSGAFKFGTNPENISSYLASKVDGTNEFSWYNKCGNLIQDSAKINFYSVLGNKIPINDDVLAGDMMVPKIMKSIPGIMAFETITTPGRASDAHSPFNLAAIQMYEKERAKLNKLNPNYEFTDLGILMFGFSDIYTQYMNIVRLFGLLNAWDANSKYTPRALIKALYHFDDTAIDDAIANKANYIAWFNTNLKYARQFVYYPEDYAITTRHAWLFGKIFRDHETRKSQIYGFAKRNYYEWDETSYETGSALKYREYWNGSDMLTTNLRNLITIFEDCLDKIRSSSSINDMVSDLRNAYDDRVMVAFADVTDDYMITPDPRDDHALMQIENMVTVPWDQVRDTSKDITQNPDNNLIVYRPYIWEELTPETYGYMKAVSRYHHYINLHNDDYGVEEVVESTRLKPLYLENEFGDGKLEIDVNAEVISGIYVSTSPDQVTALPQIGFTSLDDANMVWNQMYSYNTFDWAPAMFRYRLNLDTGNVTDSWIIMEWDRYADAGPMDGSNTFLSQLNRVCMLSLWNVPELGLR